MKLSFAIKKIFLVNLLTISFIYIPVYSYSEMLSVKGDQVNLRSGPGKDYAIKWEYGTGFPLQVIRRQNNWIKVKDFEEEQGWIHSALLDNTKHVIVNSNRNSDQSINIRTGPGISYPVVGRAHYGVVFSLKDSSNGWIQVEHESGLSGWIKSSLLWGIEN